MLDRDIIEDRMSTLGLSLAQLSAYCGVGNSRLSPWLSGQKSLPAVVTQHVYQTLVDIEKLQTAIGEDFPLDFRQIQKIKALLDRQRKGDHLTLTA